MNTCEASNSCRKLKQSLRKLIHSKVSSLSSDYIQKSSHNACMNTINQLSSLFMQAQGISIYLSMTNEISTKLLLERAFDMKKRVFIPKVIGNSAGDMIMVELLSLKDIDSFPLSRWGIPEPPDDYIQSSPDATFSGLIDLVIVPGVAFDKSRMRIGHGKGYYDCFLSKLHEYNKSKQLPPVTSISIALDDQIVEDPVPVEEHDRAIDYIVTPSQLLQRC